MTLTQTAILTRRTILGLIIFFVLATTSFVGYRIWYARYLASLPPPQEQPDKKFGIIPVPNFLKASVSSSNFLYALDTRTGGLPQFSKLVKVYFMPKIGVTFLSPDKAIALAEKFGIRAIPEVLSENLYKFSESDKTLTVNLETGNFTYHKQASPAAQELLTDNQEKLAQDFLNLLSTKGLLKEELKASPTKVVFLKFAADQLIPAQGQFEAYAAQISLFPKPIDSAPILTGDFNHSLVEAVVERGAKDLENYRFLKFIFWPVDLEVFATYPSKTSTEAFDNLRSGKGTIIVEPPTPQVSVTSVYLAYYQSDAYSPYLHPIFVFEGPSFVAYVAAVRDEFLK